MIDSIRHTSSGIEYEFSDDVTDWEKEAVREFGVTAKDEVQDALDWREAIDELSTENEKLARVQRGKHPTEDKDIGRAKTGGRGRGNDNS